MISVILVTHGRAELFRRCLVALESATNHQDFEFIILINGKDVEAEEIAISFAKGRNVKVLNRDTQLLPGQARNTLIGQSQGEWIYFADDDAQVTPMIFENFLTSKKQNPEASVFGGPNLTPSYSTAFQHACGRALASRIGSFQCADRYRQGTRLVGCDDSKLILCNLFVKADLAKASLFPSDFICAEENQALSQWRKMGAVFVYDPLLEVVHERRSTWISFILQIIKYGRGRGRLITKGEFRWYHLVPATSMLAVFYAGHSSLALLSACYLVFIGASAIKNNDTIRAASQFALAIFMIHFSYAIGTGIGAFVDAPMRYMAKKSKGDWAIMKRKQH